MNDLQDDPLMKKKDSKISKYHSDRDFNRLRTSFESYDGEHDGVIPDPEHEGFLLSSHPHLYNIVRFKYRKRMKIWVSWIQLWLFPLLFTSIPLGLWFGFRLYMHIMFPAYCDELNCHHWTNWVGFAICILTLIFSPLIFLTRAWRKAWNFIYIKGIYNTNGTAKYQKFLVWLNKKIWRKKKNDSDTDMGKNNPRSGDIQPINKIPDSKESGLAHHNEQSELGNVGGSWDSDVSSKSP